MKYKDTRIAVCFSGQLRTWEKCISTWKDFFNILEERFGVRDIDIFCHIWDFNTFPSISTLLPNVNKSKVNEVSKLTKIEIDNYINQLKPVSYKISNENISKSAIQKTLNIAKTDFFNNSGCVTPWISSQLYSIMYVAHLKSMYEIKNNFVYDSCLRMRNDIYLDNTKVYDSIKNMFIPKANTIYSCHTGIDNKQYFRRRLGDIFWYADSPTFDKLSSFYQWLPSIEPRVFNMPSAEHIFYYYAKMFNITIDVDYSSIKLARSKKYVNLRGNNKLGDHEISC